MVNRGLYNGAALACDGQLAGIVLKQHLAGDGVHYEPRWFRKWPAGATERVEIAGRETPVGDLLFDCGGVRLGIEICRDAWVTDRPGSRLAAAGADILLNPTASHFAFTKQDIRRRIVLEGSRSMRVSIAYANLVGNEAGRAIFDGDTHIACAGTMLAEGPRLSFAERVLVCADVDVEATRRLRAAPASRAARARPLAARPYAATSSGRRPRRRARSFKAPRGTPTHRTISTRSLPAPCRWRCSTICARATPAEWSFH